MSNNLENRRISENEKWFKIKTEKKIIERYGKYYDSPEELIIGVFHKMMDFQDPNNPNDWFIHIRSHT